MEIVIAGAAGFFAGVGLITGAVIIRELLRRADRER